MKRTLSACLLCLCALLLRAQDAERIRVACIGNSITYGAFVDGRFQNCYPHQLQHFLGEGYDVRNFGVSATTLLQKGDFPYTTTDAYRDALAFQPNIVIVKLGTNDTKPQNWAFRKDYRKDMRNLLKTFRQLESKPTIYVCLPVPADKDRYGIREEVISKELIPLIKKEAKKEHLGVIDLHTALMPYYGPAYFADGVHPNAKGAAVLAATVYKALTGKDAPEAHDPAQPFPGKKSNWEGYDRYDFLFHGRSCTVVAPREAAEGNPWIWRPAFFGAFDTVDRALLQKGFHVAYMDLTHLYGSPRSVTLGYQFWEAMTQECHLAKKVVVEGFSRGGYYAFNFASAHPDKVACLYVDAPVCDITSWPGKNDTELWNGFLKEWKVQDAMQGADFPGNALAHVKQLAIHRIPIMAVVGDADKTVPYTQNFLPFMHAYQQMGGPVQAIVKPGCDHHPHSLEDPTPVVDFILQHTLKKIKNK